MLQNLITPTYGVKVLPGAPLLTEIFLYTTKKIQNINDLKKLRVRAAGIRGEVFQEAGTAVVNLSPGEVVPAMEKGVIDGCEIVNLSNDLSLGMSDVAKYAYYGSSPVAGHLFFFLNQKTWDKLPKDLQDIVEKACIIAAEFDIGYGLIIEFNEIAKADKAGKVQIMHLPQEVQDHVDSSAARLYTKKRKTDRDMDMVFKAMEAWQTKNKVSLKFLHNLI